MNLVEMHDGYVPARSAGPNLGSTFLVWLPSNTAVSDAAEMNTSDREAAASARRVLVADDNTDAAMSLAMLLELLGHEVQAVHDGLQAVEAAQTFAPDFIFMDIGMPNLDGIEATRRIRALDLPRRPIVVALTGWGQESDRERSRDAGIDHHLVKPIELDEIRGLIEGLPPASPR
ncbi:MAG: response regulator [Steroidobacteraceae bacterium]